MEQALIRFETPNDVDAIHQLTKQAFAAMPYSDGSEPYIIDALRRDGDLSLSLVMECENRLIGHIAFSPIKINDQHLNWYGLGPVSVAPELQKQGYGSQLIRKGLKDVQAIGALGCALIGNPNYYKRFGFNSHKGFTYGDLDQQYVMQNPFDGEPRLGHLTYAKGFDAKPHKS